MTPSPAKRPLPAPTHDARFIPVKLRRLEPPRDDLWAALLAADFQPQERDIVVITSKVVAIDEGHCVLKVGTDREVMAQQKDELVDQEADAYIPREHSNHGYGLSMIHHALIASAGVDSSNSGDYWTLLPKNPMQSAKAWRQKIADHFGIKELGVVITDSHSLPLRRGCVDISIGFWGFNPLKDHRGQPDLFGHPLKVTMANIPDGIAGATGWLMGQADEAQPVVIVRGGPDVVFDADTDYGPGFLIEPQDDLFNALLEVFKTKGVVKRSWDGGMKDPRA
jgi:F420-0:gamma-glutamyl ligase